MDYVNGRNIHDFVDGHMIVGDVASFFVEEVRGVADPVTGRPYQFYNICRILQGYPFHQEGCIFCANHVEQDAIFGNIICFMRVVSPILSTLSPVLLSIRHRHILRRSVILYIE